jgi:hypothetical protein
MDFRNSPALPKPASQVSGQVVSFLLHDGIPWNNNNAEHAVERFAEFL